tara:strand:- start:348 stop:539 length:192 start_codon:yes stop_codon:yes gene_type:complete
MKINPFPQVNSAFIKALEEHFPAKDFDTSTDLRALDHHYGQRSVINFLKAKFDEQNETILKPD